MEISNNNSEKKKSVWYLLMYACVFAGLAGGMFYYLFLSGGHMPLMDYWKGGTTYLNRILYEPFKIEYLVTFPHPIHWNVLDGIFSYFFVRVFRCDNYAYIYAGMIVVCIITFIMIVYYNCTLRCNNIIMDFCGLIICLLPIYNLNQWEILTLFCSFAFMIRICFYICMWIWLDRILKKNCKTISALLYGGISFLIIMFASQAYYPGFSAAICGAIFLDAMANRRVNRNHIILFISQIMSVVICYLTTDISGALSQNAVSISTLIVDYFKGFLFMLAATVVPVTMQTSFETCYIIGAFIFFVVLGAIYIFFKKQMYKKTYLPIIFLMYAFVNIVIIITGRMYAYGFGTLGSSRYVIETTIGLMGVLQIYWYEISEETNKRSNIGDVVCVTSIVCAIIFANSVEMKIAPYRKIYNNNMQNLAENIDQATDDELSIFQAPPEDVRDMVLFMKENHLCIWKD